MLKLRTKQDLQAALRRLRRYQQKETKYKSFYDKYRTLVVRYMETKNRKRVEDEEGNTYQKRQAVRIIYPENAKDLRKLLKKKGVDPSTVISMVRQDPVTVVDEEAILRLLKQKTITAEELEAVIIRQTFTPYLVRLNGRKKKHAVGRGRRS